MGDRTRQGFGQQVANASSVSPLAPVATFGALAVASAANVGAQCYVTGLDATYRCVQTGTNTYAWRLADAAPQDPYDADDLLAWEFNDTTFPIVNHGTSGAGDNLVITTGTPQLGAAGLWDSGMYVPDVASDYYITAAGRAANTPGAAAILVRAWARPFELQGSNLGSIIRRTNGAGNGVIDMYARGTGITGAAPAALFRTYVGGVNKDVIGDFQGGVSGGWNQYAACVITTTMYGFINGTLVGSVALGAAIDIDNTGTWMAGGFWKYHGVIGPIRDLGHADMAACARNAVLSLAA